MRYLMTIKNRVMIEWWYATWFSNARKLGHFGGLVSTRMHEGLATGDKGKERNQDYNQNRYKLINPNEPIHMQL